MSPKELCGPDTGLHPRSGGGRCPLQPLGCVASPEVQTSQEFPQWFAEGARGAPFARGNPTPRMNPIILAQPFSPSIGLCCGPDLEAARPGQASCCATHAAAS
jgi:hypothetical protein